MISRRAVLKTGIATLFGLHFLKPESLFGQILSPTNSFKIRALTKGPKFHWFGYYDKLQFDPSGRYVLGMEVGFEHRSPDLGFSGAKIFREVIKLEHATYIGFHGYAQEYLER
jgi:hypothetical protein